MILSIEIFFISFLYFTTNISFYMFSFFILQLPTPMALLCMDWCVNSHFEHLYCNDIKYHFYFFSLFHY